MIRLLLLRPPKPPPPGVAADALLLCHGAIYGTKGA